MSGSMITATVMISVQSKYFRVGIVNVRQEARPSATPVDLTVMTHGLYGGASGCRPQQPDARYDRDAFSIGGRKRFPGTRGRDDAEAASAGGRLLVGFQEASIINAAKRAASLKELASTQRLRATTFAGPSMRVDATK